MDSVQEKRHVRLICLALALGTFFLYCSTLRHDFITLDDATYVGTNSHVKDGLSLSGMVWAFTSSGYAGNWHPLTWISHMVDCQLYGVGLPGGHHCTNVLLHIANALLLFFLLRRITGALWRSALVAALFAWHPVHVESVAWISERKDVLSAFFWLLALLAYARYVLALKAHGPKIRFHYGMALLWFVLGLLSKPMVVTLPFVLLLMDYWPLKRIALSKKMEPVAGLRQQGDESIKKLVTEKLPFFALALVSSIVTFIAQKQGGAVSSLKVLPLQLRICNTLISYVRYLGKIAWPTHLAIIYPFQVFPAWAWMASAALLLVVSVLAFMMVRRRPWFFTGWFWFLGTLVPVIGLVQVGKQGMADRYMYLPAIGIFLIVVWSGGEAVKRLPRLRPLALAAGCMGLFACWAVTWVQLGYWKNSVTLFTHALAVAPLNAMALDHLGIGLENEGKAAEAMTQYQRALALEPMNASTLGLIGFNLASRGDYSGALEYYQKSLSFEDSSTIRYNFGNALMAQGKFAEAEAQYVQALRRDSQTSEDIHNNLGAVLARLGRWDEAEAHLKTALRLRPNFPEAQDQLGGVMQKKGRLDQASFHYAEAVRLKPDFAHAHLKLGLLMAQQGQVIAALSHFQTVIALEPTNAYAHFNLGAGYAALGNWNSAAQAFAIAARLKPDDADIQKRLAEAQAKAGGVPKLK